MLDSDHLTKLGMEQKRLGININRLVALVADMPPKTKKEISLLKDQLDELYAYVNMEVSNIIFAVEAALIILPCRMIMGHA